MSANPAAIVAAFGASGSGKTLRIKAGLAAAKPSRLLVWDPQGEYQAHGRTYTDRARLLANVRSAESFRAVYQPGDRLDLYAERFEWFCRLAYALGNLRLVVDELADVTTPSKAPAAWSVVTRKGRHRGLVVVVASQRPAGVDKDLFSQCTHVSCGRLNFARDLAVMGEVLDVDPARLKALPDLAYIERDMRTGATREGAVKPPRRASPTRT